MTIKMKIDGLKGIDKALNQFTAKQVKSIARRSLKKGAVPMVEAAKSKAPNDPQTNTNLGETIVLGTKLNKNAKKAHRKVRDKTTIEMFMGPTSPYAHYPEFGTAHQSPQPYMRPSFDGEAKNVIDETSKLLWENIAKAAKRNARKK